MRGNMMSIWRWRVGTLLQHRWDETLMIMMMHGHCWWQRSWKVKSANNGVSFSFLLIHVRWRINWGMTESLKERKWDFLGNWFKYYLRGINLGIDMAIHNFFTSRVLLDWTAVCGSSSSIELDLLVLLGFETLCNFSKFLHGSSLWGYLGLHQLKKYCPLSPPCYWNSIVSLLHSKSSSFMSFPVQI